MREKNYFSHDYHSRDHLRDVRKDWGLSGYGFYWCLVEILHEQGGYIKESELESIAYDLRAEYEMAQAIVYKYGMFQVKKGKISSDRVVENLQKRAELSQKCAAAANSRWGSTGDAGDEELPVLEVPQEYLAPKGEEQKTADWYADHFTGAVNSWIASQEDILSTTLYNRTIIDYQKMFEAIIAEVRNKQYVVINKQRVPTYYFLHLLCTHIKRNNDFDNLNKAISDVEKRYKSGKVKNKMQYMISALYNAAILDTNN